MTRHTSAAGRRLIEQREGVRLKAYRDSAGVLTIGAGHTGRASSPVVLAGMTCTREQADLWLTQDLVAIEKAVDGLLQYEPTQNQFDAMISLVHNIGLPAFSHSTVLRLFNADNAPGAADAFMMWDKAASPKTKALVVVPGLVNRRRAERLQFLTPDAAGAEPATAPGGGGPTSPPVVALAPMGFWARGVRALVYWFFDIDLQGNVK